MNYKNNRQMELVKKAKFVYAIESLMPTIQRMFNKVREAFVSIVDALRKTLEGEPEYIKLPPRQTAPRVISPSHNEPSRTVFLPIQRFRSRR